jgi:DNA mismatch repair ATPase MutS
MASSVKKLADLLGLGLDESVATTMHWIAEGDGDMAIFGKAWNHPEHVQLLLAEAGRLDMLAAVALCRRTCFPEQDDTTLELVDLYHPGLEPGARVYNTVRMGGRDGSSGSSTHVLLTGPNRGGKSTLLKALGSAVLMSQTVGVVFARKARLPVFGSIVTALSPADRLGELSLFEAEIEFAKGVRATVAGATKPVFLMMDEIFHGTNAHDGVEASQVFLDDLYASSPAAPVFSVVSTHYMELPKRYGDGRTQLLCMEASVDPTDSDRLVYTYRLCPGVNRFSSVREILRERGLLACGTPAQKTSVSAAE